MIQFSRYLISILLCSSIIGAKAQNITYSSVIPTEELRIVVDHALGGTVSDWFDELSYTPLETKNNSEILQSVYRTGIIGNSIGILPNNGKRFYIYSTEGRLIKAIDCTKIPGLPKNEGIHNMQVWDEDFMLSSENYQIKMDNKGENMVVLKEQRRYGADSVRVGESVWKYIRYDSVDNPNIALTFNNTPVVEYNDTKANYFFDKDTYFSPVSIPHGLSYFLPDNHYKIFELEESSVSKVYNFIFPQHNLIDTSLVYSSHATWANKVIEQEDKIHAFDHIVRYGDYLIFKAGLYHFYGFNVVTKDFISFSDIIPDQSNDYMEVFSLSPILTDGQYLYTFIPSYAVQNSRDMCDEENHTMRKEYQDLLKQYNLILVRFKLKS